MSREVALLLVPYHVQCGKPERGWQEVVRLREAIREAGSVQRGWLGFVPRAAWSVSGQKLLIFGSNICFLEAGLHFIDI